MYSIPRKANLVNESLVEVDQSGVTTRGCPSGTAPRPARGRARRTAGEASGWIANAWRAPLPLPALPIDTLARRRLRHPFCSFLLLASSGCHLGICFAFSASGGRRSWRLGSSLYKSGCPGTREEGAVLPYQPPRRTWGEGLRRTDWIDSRAHFTLAIGIGFSTRWEIGTRARNKGIGCLLGIVRLRGIR